MTIVAATAGDAARRRGAARRPARVWSWRLHRRAPHALLGLVSLASLGARLWYLPNPAGGARHASALIFDETYYVNAARVLLGIHPPAGAPYASALLGHDPNAEHPPLVKLLVALSMKVFGDNAWGWRAVPLLFGSLAILAVFWMVRSARGGPWLALGAASLMAADNLLLVHGRIATLDIVVVTLMVVAVALHLRERPLLAGLVLAAALCAKLVAVDVVFVLLLVEAGRVLLRDGDGARLSLLRARGLALLVTVVTGGLGYLALLYGLDLVASPIGGAGSCATVAAGFHNPIQHTDFMLCYATKLTSPGGPSGIASYPWQWLLDQQPIDYYKVVSNVVANGAVVATRPLVWFRGEINPAIITLALPALGLAVHNAWRRRDRAALLAVAWFLGTYVPFVVAAAPLGAFGNRISYLYYMVVVMPAIYVAVAEMLSSRWLPRAALLGYIAILGYWFVTLYPFQTWSGS